MTTLQTRGLCLCRHDLAARIARDIPDATYVNLGIGMPTLVADHLPSDREIVFHSENGILGFGPAPAPDDVDPELINASKQHVTMLPGGSFFHHTDAFVMMRGGHLDISVLGAFQVSPAGDLANWATDVETYPPAVGGAMDLAVGAKRVFAMTTHLDKQGRPKLVAQCTYPLTAAAVVDRVYTDLAVIDVRAEGFVVREIVEGLDLDGLATLTGAPLHTDGDISVLRAAVVAA